MPLKSSALRANINKDDTPIKRALILSGGGALGAFQGGFLFTERVQYDLIAGISTGSLSGIMVAQGKEDSLKALWESLAGRPELIYNSPVFRKDGTVNKWQLLGRILRRWPLKSLADNRPLRDLINTYVDYDKIVTEAFLCGVVSLLNNQYYCLCHNGMNEENLHKALLASSAIPVVFPPTDKVETQTEFIGSLVDGGVSYGTPTGDAIRWIRSNSPAHEEWELTVIMCNDGRTLYKDPPRSILEVGARVFHAGLSSTFKKDIDLFKAYNKDPNYKTFSYRIIRPKNDLAGNLNFSESAIAVSWDEGVRIANENDYETWHK